MLEADALDGEQAIGGMAAMVNVADTASVQAGVVAVEVAWGGMDIPVYNSGNFNMASIDRSVSRTVAASATSMSAATG